MAKVVSTEVLAAWFSAFAGMANNALGPAQKEWATRCAGEVLYVIGLPEFKAGHTTFIAVEPEAGHKVIDAEAKQLLVAVERPSP